MSDVNDIPLMSLTVEGQLHSDESIISRLYLYFITSLESQTYFHYSAGKSAVTSFRGIAYTFDEYTTSEFNTILVEKLKTLYATRYDRIHPTIIFEEEVDSVTVINIDIIMYRDEVRVGRLVRVIEVADNEVMFRDDNIDDLGKGK